MLKRGVFAFIMVFFMCELGALLESQLFGKPVASTGFFWVAVFNCKIQPYLFGHLNRIPFGNQFTCFASLWNVFRHTPRIKQDKPTYVFQELDWRFMLRDRNK